MNAASTSLALRAESNLWRRIAHQVENSLLTLVLASLVALPLTEAVLRKLIQTGIPGSAGLVQHLTLIVCMLGAAVAARDGKLLTLFEFAALGNAAARAVCRAISHLGAAAVAGLLIVATDRLIETERAAGSILAFAIPVWMV